MTRKEWHKHKAMESLTSIANEIREATDFIVKNNFPPFVDVRKLHSLLVDYTEHYLTMVDAQNDDKVR